ncbi:MAG: hypothetical protein CGW95_13925 [Phenylobacterium zucineum]|nr:MAG: hypothetical protein CGW95_13925 [Phenylobacterium zucineum]
MAAPDSHRVFASHAWESRATEAMVDDFIAKLRLKLMNLPAWPQRVYRVELWFDRNDLNGRSGRFDDQTVPAAKASKALLMLMSDKYHQSDACRVEADCFRDPSGAFQHKRTVKIQVSGRRQDGDPEMVQGPVFPEMWNPKYPTLLALWSKGDLSDQDVFLMRIRDELLAVLDA